MPAADTCVTARSFFNIKVGVDSFLPSFVLNNFSLFSNELISETPLPSISEIYNNVSSVLIAKVVTSVDTVGFIKANSRYACCIILRRNVQNFFEICITRMAELRWKMLGKRRRTLGKMTGKTNNEH